MSDATSSRGTSPIVDQALFNRSVTSIRHACANLSNLSIDQNDVRGRLVRYVDDLRFLVRFSRWPRRLPRTPLHSVTYPVMHRRRRPIPSLVDVSFSRPKTSPMPPLIWFERSKYVLVSLFHPTARPPILSLSLQTLDNSYSPEHHRHCIETSRPLMQAIDDLYSFATSKEFAGNAPTISVSVRSARLSSTTHPCFDDVSGTSVARADPLGRPKCHRWRMPHRRMLEDLDHQFERTIALAAARDTHEECLRIDQASGNIGEVCLLSDREEENVIHVVCHFRELAPGQQECERAIEQLRKLFQDVDKAIMQVDAPPKPDRSPQVHHLSTRDVHRHLWPVSSSTPRKLPRVRIF